MQPPNKLLEAALDGWRQGLFILPLHTIESGQCTCKDGKGCTNPGKHPRIKWKYLAKSDEKQLRIWWGQWPNANVGVATGKRSGLIVLDMDPRHGGDRSLALVGQYCGPLPETRKYRTGGGGLQFFFLCPEGVAIHNSARMLVHPETGEVLDGLDIRGEGGIAVMPPSLHKSGNRYQWVAQDTPIALLPEKLLEIILAAQAHPPKHQARQPSTYRPPADRQSAIAKAREKWSLPALATAVEGNRNDTLFRLAQQLRDDGLSEEEAVSIIQEYVDRVPGDDFTETEALATLHSAYSQPAREPAKRQGSAQKGQQQQSKHQGDTSAMEKIQDQKDAAQANQGEQQTNQPSELVALALERDKATLFMTPEGTRYALVSVNGHREAMPLGEKCVTFRHWLMSEYHQAYSKSPNATALSTAIQQLEAFARFGRQGHLPIVQDVFYRLGQHHGKLYLDLGDANWTIIEIDGQGWREVKNPPVSFRRPNGMGALPRPVHGGKLDELRQFINVASDEDWMLIISWLLGTLHPYGPYANLNLYGEQGTAKSSATRFLRGLIDPAKAMARGLPKDEAELALYAHNALVVALENLSHLPKSMSDAICRTNTGAGEARRKLYTDDEEMIFADKRPFILNGIDEIVAENDLIDRCIFVRLPVIDESQRKDEATLEGAYNQARPRILGALLEAVSAAMRGSRTVKLLALPRMADFARWVVAAEKQLGWKPGAWLEAYNTNRKKARASMVEASPLARAVLRLMSSRDKWDGTALALLNELEKPAFAAPEDVNSKVWPHNPRWLSSYLTRLAPSLRANGIDASSHKRMDGTHWTLEKMPDGTPPDDKREPSDTANPHMGAGGVGANGARKNSTMLAPCHQSSIQEGRWRYGANGAIFLNDSERKEEEREEEEEGVVKKDSEILRHSAISAMKPDVERPESMALSMVLGKSRHVLAPYSLDAQEVAPAAPAPYAGKATRPGIRRYEVLEPFDIAPRSEDDGAIWDALLAETGPEYQPVPLSQPAPFVAEVDIDDGEDNLFSDEEDDAPAPVPAPVSAPKTAYHPAPSFRLAQRIKAEDLLSAIPRWREEPLVVDAAIGYANAGRPRLRVPLLAGERSPKAITAAQGPALFRRIGGAIDAAGYITEPISIALDGLAHKAAWQKWAVKGGR